MRLRIGTLREDPSRSVELTPETLFGRHCAILGATGGGKSWTLARLVEECARFRSKVILFDPSGEYHTMREGVRHVTVGGRVDRHSGARQVAIPYTELLESDLFAIFKPAGAVQATKLRAAVKSLKLARVAPLLAAGGTILKAHRFKADYEEEYNLHYALVEDPRNLFDIRYLIHQIQNECVDFQRSSVESATWGGPNGVELSGCVPLMSRIQEIINSASFAPIFQPGSTPSLFEELRDFFTDPELRVLCVSLEAISFQHRVREIATNAVGRYLLELARADAFHSMPVVCVLDEAHQFLGGDIQPGDETPLEAFGLIAKEGRKYCLTLCLATQRPRDIPEDVLSQVGTMLVHRITNDRDRTTIERAVGPISQDGVALLPSLQTGEALLMGTEFSGPVVVKIHRPQHPPDSGGPDYQRFWF
jgi:uncharacterized protein